MYVLEGYNYNSQLMLRACRNKANAKWNLLERNNVRKLIECYESVKKYFSEKKQKVASAFTYPFQEADSQSKTHYCTGVPP